MLDKTSSIICAFGLASAAPRSPYRHLELCGIALGVRKTVFEKWNSNCLSGLVTSTRLGRGSIKSHVRTVQGVGMGLFAFQERVTSLARCNNTHDFVPKSCAKDAAPPLESPLTPPMGDVGSPHRREGLRKGAPRLFAARERHFCGSVITHYDTFSPAVCKV